jgi:hypothetical protein
MFIIEPDKTPAGTEITNTNYWTIYNPATQSEVFSTRTKDNQINDAILTQADVEVPLSGYDVKPLVRCAYFGQWTTSQSYFTNHPESRHCGWHTRWYERNSTSRWIYCGLFDWGWCAAKWFASNNWCTIPVGAVAGDYCLRLDYFPNRLFRYDSRRWVKIEDKVRTNLNNGSTNDTLRSGFVNNTYTTSTTDLGNIPQRQSLSQILRPRADNGDQKGFQDP